MRNRRPGHQTRPEPLLGEHAVRNAAILVVAGGAFLAVLVTAFLPGNGNAPRRTSDPQAKKEADEDRAIEELSRRFQVAAKVWLKDRLKDPDSLEPIRWTGPTKNEDNNWLALPITVPEP